jgi:hypothetical protein
MNPPKDVFEIPRALPRSVLEKQQPMILECFLHNLAPLSFDD